jgi:DNA-binding transcriptional ArsR family regulator
MNITDLANSSGRASEFLKSLANAQRLRILCLVMEGERPVGEIAEAVGANQSSVSERLDAPVFTTDGDFTLYARHLPVKLFQPRIKGTHMKCKLIVNHPGNDSTGLR